MSRRARLAGVLTASAALLALAVALLGFWLAGRASDPARPIVTQVDQVGDRIAIVRVEGGDTVAAAGASRASALRWVVVALGVGLLPVAGLSWWGAGRLVLKAASPGDDPADGAPEPADPSPPAEDSERRRQLQDVVHELRTPLAVAATNLDLAATTPGLDDDLAARLAAARRGVERLARTVDDLSVHGRLAVGEDRGLIDLAAEAQTLAADQAGPARLRGLTLTVRAPSGLTVGANRAAVHTAIGNLLGNAVRLAPSGSAIELACGTWEDWAWIAVRDEGPGLAPEDHRRAFDRYWRGRYDSDRADPNDGGSARGIGLTIARQMTEALGGHVTVDSAVGAGSTFIVWLPRSPDARTEQVVADDGVHHRVDPLPEPAALPRGAFASPVSPPSSVSPVALDLL